MSLNSFQSCLLAVSIFVLAPASLACEQIRAAFDVGSGATKMKVYRYDTCTQSIIEQIEKVDGIECEQEFKVAYKEDLKKTNFIKPKTIVRGVQVLRELKKSAKSCGATEFAAVATSAFRQASNGDLVAKLLRVSGVKVSIISQEEEALLGAKGALAKIGPSKREQNICVWDIGGSSVQITCLEGQESKVYLGHLASTPFKDKLIELKGNEASTPNPISQDLYTQGVEFASSEAELVKEKLGNSLSSSLVLGIGSVHYYALSKVLGNNVIDPSMIHDHLLSEKLDRSDEELGGDEYVDSAVSNMILVEAMMRHLNIPQVEVLKVNLTEGLSASAKYWK